jgi:uncharacterized protein
MASATSMLPCVGSLLRPWRCCYTRTSLPSPLESLLGRERCPFHLRMYTGDQMKPQSVFHTFRRGGRTLLFAPGSSTTMQLDGAGEKAIGLLVEARGSASLGSTPTDQQNDVRDALGELLALRQRGHFDVRIPPALSLDRPFDAGISVVLSHHCNLACAHCFRRGRPSVGPPVMSQDVMEAAAKFIVARLESLARVCRVGVGMTSEIALQLPLRDAFAQALRMRAAARDRVGVANINATNLTAFSQPEVACQLERINVRGVSLDGPPEAHDRLRRYPDGRGTYGDAVKGLASIRARGQAPYVAAVVTAYYPDVSEVYFHLFDLGFRTVLVKPVRAEPNRSFAIGQNLAALCSGYDRFVDRLLGLDDEALLDCLLRFVPGGFDYFARFLTRVVECHYVDRRCPAGVGLLTIDTDGRLYLCDSFVGVPEACIGTVWEGVDVTRVRRIDDASRASQAGPCCDCWARPLCGGGCMHQSYLTFGEFGPPDPSECALNKHLIELAMWFYAELRATRPQVLAALPREARVGWQGLSAVIKCAAVPDGTGRAVLDRLQHLPAAVISPEGHLTRRLWDAADTGDVEVRVGWNRKHLHLLLTPRGQEAERGWTHARTVTVATAVPRAALRATATRALPAALDEWNAALVGDLEEGRVEHAPSEWVEAEAGRPVRSRLQMGRAGAWFRVAWADLGSPRPSAGLEFGLQVSIADAHGGRLEWYPRHTAGRMRLEHA